MKIIAIIIGILTLTITSCDKDEVGDTYDFSNSLAPNVELNTTVKGKTITVKEGKKFKVPVLLRTAMQEAVNVTYSITGGVTQQGTLSVLRNNVNNTSNTADSVLIPVGSVPVGSTSITAKLSLTSAKDATNDTLAIGRLGKELEFMNLKVTK